MMAHETDRLLTDARAWLEQDPDDETKTELALLLQAASGHDEDDAAAALAELHSRFGGRLAFGTAGLRGALGAGPNRMNRVLVAQAAAGLAAYLVEKAGHGAAAASGSGPDAERAQTRPAASIVIGYDGRKNSQVFARDTAELMAGAGIRAVLLPRLLPTPVLAFAVRHLDVSAGVMVTASHNPADDNGYKVYLGGADRGAQIVPPADAEIAAHILRVAEGSITALPRSGDYEIADESVIDAYVAATAEVAATVGRAYGGGRHVAEPSQPSAADGAPEPAGPTDAVQAEPGEGAPSTEPASPASRPEPVVVYTAMHGVGWETVARVFDAAGIPRPHVVEAQIDPDASFPTVTFPNPEEHGALDLAFQTARQAGADLVIANDPDADRLAVAIPDASADGGYRRLSGNDVGAILGWMVAKEAFDRGQHGTIAVSIVSSPALSKAADSLGHDFVETLTGFKWVARAPHLIFGFEEALGYLVNPQTVHDKDGISAATLFLAIVRRLKAEGSSIEEQLDRFADAYGAYASDQISVRFTDLSRITAVMRSLRQAAPTHIGTIGIRHIDDLQHGFESLPPSDVLRLWLHDGSRVVVRPSGTEPKLKIYIDAVSTEGTAQERRMAAEARVRELTEGVHALLADNNVAR